MDTDMDVPVTENKRVEMIGGIPLATLRLKDAMLERLRKEESSPHPDPARLEYAREQYDGLMAVIRSNVHAYETGYTQPGFEEATPPGTT